MKKIDEGSTIHICNFINKRIDAADFKYLLQMCEIKVGKLVKTMLKNKIEPCLGNRQADNGL